jgi:ubiquinone/menaquinone biosynthesis C-methylase UbiE
VPVVSDSLERVRRIYNDSADGYDCKIAIPERLLFGSGRQWATSLAASRTLEVAAGTGRNLPHYDQAVSLTAVDLSERMLAHAQRRAASLGREVEFRVADARRFRSTTRRLTRSWRHSRCAASPTTRPVQPRWLAC